MIAVVILYVLITQSSASFFTEFTGALGSVKSKVGKLITDVGYDLKETVDCATFAVEEVIYDKDQISHYYDKCKEASTENTSTSVGPVTKGPAAINIIIKPIEPVTVEKIKDVETTTKSSVVVIDGPKVIEEKISKVELVVNDEFSHVSNVTSHLENDFLGLSKTVDEKLKAIEHEKAEVEKTLLEIKQLQTAEELEIERNKDEIREIFEEILKRMNKSTLEVDLRSEMNDAVKDIEKYSSKAVLEEIEKWKNKGLDQLKDLKESDAGNKQSTTESNIPLTFKELASILSKDTSTNILVQETTTITVTTKSLKSTTSHSTSIEDFTLVSSTTTVKTNVSDTFPSSTERSSFPDSHNEPKISSTIDLSTHSTVTVKDMSTTSTTDAPLSNTISNVPATSTTSTSIVTTLSSINSVNQSTTVATTTSLPDALNTDFLNSSTISSTISIPTRPSESTSVPTSIKGITNEAITSKPEEQTSTATSTSSFKSETTSVTTSINTPIVISTSEASTVATITSKEPDKKSTTVTSAEKSLSPILVTSTTYNRPVDITTTRSTEPVLLTSMLTSSTTVAPETLVTKVTTTEPPILTVADNFVVTLITTTTSKPISSNTISTVKKTKKKKRPHVHIKVHQIPEETPPPPQHSDIDDLIPQDTAAAVADALKIFGGSIKRKSALDKFFKNLK